MMNRWLSSKQRRSSPGIALQMRYGVWNACFFYIQTLCFAITLWLSLGFHFNISWIYWCCRAMSQQRNVEPTNLKECLLHRIKTGRQLRKKNATHKHTHNKKVKRAAWLNYSIVYRVNFFGVSLFATERRKWKSKRNGQRDGISLRICWKHNRSLCCD